MIYSQKKKSTLP